MIFVEVPKDDRPTEEKIAEIKALLQPLLNQTFDREPLIHAIQEYERTHENEQEHSWER